jgi:hypothetical protein
VGSRGSVIDKMAVPASVIGVKPSGWSSLGSWGSPRDEDTGRHWGDNLFGGGFLGTWTTTGVSDGA